MSSNKVEVKVNYAGVGALLKSSEMASALASLAQAAAQKAGIDAESVTTDPYTGVTRVNVRVGK